jgi:type VI secretion system secreted protein Hcp
MPEFNQEISEGLGLYHGGLTAQSRSTSFYLQIAEIPGGCQEKKHEKQILLTGFEYQLVSPRDVATGQASGKRVHYPVEVAGRVDKGTPLLFKAVAENQQLKSVKIHCFKAADDASGTKQGDTEIYTVDMTNGRVSRFKHFTYEDGTMFFLAAFTFQQITLTFVDGGITHQDDWSGT